MKNAIVLPLKSSPREWRTAILFMMLAYIPMSGQNMIDQHGNAKPQSLSKEQIEFNERLDAFVDSYIKDQKLMDQYSEQRHTCSANKEVDIISLAMEEARHQFIVQNIEEYKQLFMGAEQSVTIMDICENGGFEDDFLYYEGFTSTYEFGSDSCSPHDSSGPSVFVPATLPTTDRFEIVTTGPDPLVGIDQTRFGNKALRINNRYGHSTDCEGNYGIDKLTKKFVVTSANRIFTLWYAVVLENPSGHADAQPFFSLTCDLDPGGELCYAADYLDCDSTYTDSICMFDGIDVLDWTCHKFRIDTTYIGDTATLEIMVADCGAGAHFGYAYIDGICEDCDGSSLGTIILDSINYNSCDRNVAHICGSYTPPVICNQNWWLDSVMVNGYTITEVFVDTGSHTFCFDFRRSNFGSESCLDLYLSGRFTNGSTFLPFQTSNELEICKDNYLKPSLDIDVSGCMDNTPEGETPNNNISDDYYFVTVDIGNVSGLAWTIERTLVDPYPNELDTRQIADGTGNAEIELGPFRIQEGGWLLTLYVSDSCEYEKYIEPPAYCSGCSAFYNVEISNIQCDDDEWSFDLYVPSETGMNYTLDGISYSYNTIHTIDVGAIDQECIVYTLSTGTCDTKFTICPPKPCSFNCNLEVYVEDVPCTKDEYDVNKYYVDLKVQWPPSKYACYKAIAVSNGSTLDDGPLPSPQQVGPFTEDIYLTLFVCTSSNCTNCPCFKTIYVPTPDCNGGGAMPLSGVNEATDHFRSVVSVKPNPTNSGEIVIYSDLPETNYEVLDVHGRWIFNDSFTGTAHQHSLPVPSGLYFLRYWDRSGHTFVLKIIKQ